MNTLHAIGFWRSAQWRLHFPHPKELVDRNPISDRNRHLVNYLRNGEVVCEQMGYSYCRFKGGPPDHEMGNKDLTDGHWVWPEALAIYVENYHVLLPSEFLEHAIRNNYIIPNG